MKTSKEGKELDIEDYYSLKEDVIILQHKVALLEEKCDKKL